MTVISPSPELPNPPDPPLLCRSPFHSIHIFHLPSLSTILFNRLDSPDSISKSEIVDNSHLLCRLYLCVLQCHSFRFLWSLICVRSSRHHICFLICIVVWFELPLTKFAFCSLFYFLQVTWSHRYSRYEMDKILVWTIHWDCELLNRIHFVENSSYITKIKPIFFGSVSFHEVLFTIALVFFKLSYLFALGVVR